MGLVIFILCCIILLCGMVSIYIVMEYNSPLALIFLFIGIFSAIISGWIVSDLELKTQEYKPYCSVCQEYYDFRYEYCPIDGVELEKK